MNPSYVLAIKDLCLDCGHPLDAHDEEGVCAACSEMLNTYFYAWELLSGGLQGANISPCNSLVTNRHHGPEERL